MLAKRKNVTERQGSKEACSKVHPSSFDIPCSIFNIPSMSVFCLHSLICVNPFFNLCNLWLYQSVKAPVPFPAVKLPRVFRESCGHVNQCR